MNQSITPATPAMPKASTLDELFEEVDRLEGRTSTLLGRLERVSRAALPEASSTGATPPSNDLERLVLRVRSVTAQIEAGTSRLDI